MITIATIRSCMIISAIVRRRRREKHANSCRQANSRQTVRIGVFTTVFSLLGSASGLILMLETFELRILYVTLPMIVHAWFFLLISVNTLLLQERFPLFEKIKMNTRELVFTYVCERDGHSCRFCLFIFIFYFSSFQCRSTIVGREQ